MKKMCMFAAIAAMIFSSCSKENDDNPAAGSTNGVAYLSIKVDSRPQSRAGGSTENTSLEDESMLNSLYLFTFNADSSIVGIPGSNVFYYEFSGLEQNKMKAPDPVKLSASAKNLVMVANPGAKLLAAITSLHAGSTLATFNAAIADVMTDEIKSDKGFAMITGGNEAGKNVDEKITEPYVAIGDKLKTVEEAGSESAAQDAAQGDRLTVRLERLVSKLIVREKTDGITTVEPGAKFSLTAWTVDAVNSSYYPFAMKTLIDASHTAGDYTRNFYTQDPNYTGAIGTGIVYGTVDAENNNWSYAPILPWTNGTYTNGYYSWKNVATADEVSDENQIAYVIENTMDATEQKFGNATRLVIKATYTPFATEGADWFNWAGSNYESLTLLQDAYKEAIKTGATPLTTACDAFYEKIKTYYGNTLKSGFTAGNFEGLTEAELNGVSDGGEVVKDGNKPVIRWYQKGLCYYYYEIRHDNNPDAGYMAFAKYGVVRNNWYNLTLNTVSGPGTPWYPDINNPGSGDPEPKDPIDAQAGYLGVTVQVAKWIFWETDFNI